MYPYTPSTLLFQLLHRNKFELRGVHAVPLPCRLGAIIKEMPKMGISFFCRTSAIFLPHPKPPQNTDHDLNLGGTSHTSPDFSRDSFDAPLLPGKMR